jgi:microcystin-dependent protein
MDGFIGEIRLFAANFAPQGWALCNGQILSISQNTALFSIIGTYYGGNGINNFALPNLKGKVPVGTGQGSGLTWYNIGQETGTATITLTSSNLPPHTHAGVAGTITMPINNSGANKTTPNGNYFAYDGTQKFDVQTDGVTMKPANVNLSVANAGSSAAINNMMPYQVINYVICLTGIYPTRN